MASLLARIDRQIFEAIWNKLNEARKGKVTRRTVYSRIEAIREEYEKTISARTAAYLLAARMDVDVYRFVKDKNELKELQDLLKARTTPTVYRPKIDKERGKVQQVVIGNKILEAFLLPSNLAKEAQRMSDVYPELYVFENVLRNVVKSVLERRYGGNWWQEKSVVSNTIRNNVVSRKRQEGKNRWHAVRGSHEIFYTNFGDLSSIIAANWSDFKTIFPSLNWIQSRMSDVEQSRNIVAHNNPLPQREIRRIKLYFGDLKKQLERTTK